MKSFILALAVCFSSCVSICAQEAKTTPESNRAPVIAITAETSPMDLARAAFTAQGGEKFHNVQNMPEDAFAIPR
jgi:hypothetical protein